MTMPSQHKSGSKQTYGTPPDFLKAVVNKFGPISFDLAASKVNACAEDWFDANQNSLIHRWSTVQGTKWLNPPFADIRPWAKKASQCVATGMEGQILMLTPASVGSEWFACYVWPYATVYAVRPRLTFVGCKDPYPKDLILSVFGTGWVSQLKLWRWTDTATRVAVGGTR